MLTNAIIYPERVSSAHVNMKRFRPEIHTSKFDMKNGCVQLTQSDLYPPADAALMSCHSDCMLDTSLLVPVGMIRVNVPQSQHVAAQEGGSMENRGGVKGKGWFLPDYNHQ